MTQSTILLTTLAVMLGLGMGYWFGWLSDPSKPIRMVIAYTVSLTEIMDGMYSKQLDLAAMIREGRAYER